MIKYSIQCDKRHEFEAWFASSSDYEKQADKGLVECPVCGSNRVEKMLMAPSVSGTKKSVGSEQLPVASMPNNRPALPDEMLSKLREMKQHIEKNAEDVGEKFPEEVRKIHYGESKPRGIFGKATPKEAGELLEEGVGVIPIPELPEDKN